jgi:nucleotide-binding universal stress UspA family protein
VQRRHLGRKRCAGPGAPEALKAARSARCTDLTLMQTLLVAVDGSAPSLRGVFHAAQVAKALGARVDLVYVSFPKLLPPAVYAKVLDELEAAESEHAKAVLDGAARSIADQGVECRKVRASGTPADAIAELAGSPDVWGVVIGAEGHHALSRVMLGSVADRLAHICPKPVTIVR